MPLLTPRRLLLSIAMLLLALPAAASAQTPVVSIDGNPLRIFTDPMGSVQVAVGGRDVNTTAEFCCSATSPNAGFNIVIDPGGSTPMAWGPYANFPFPNADNGPTLTAGNPSRITSSWTLPDAAGTPALKVTQVLEYTNGQRQFDSIYTVQNINPQARYAIRPYVGGDLTIRGSDSGVGVFQPGPPRVIGGLNQDVGGTGVFVEETPWSHYEEGNYSTVRSDASGPGLNDSFSTDFLDNGAAVQWDGTLAPAGTSGDAAAYRVAWRFVDTFGITPAVAAQQTGNDQKFTAQVGDVNGNPAGAGKKVIWSVVGSNFTLKPQTTTTDKDGQTTFSYVGGNPGQDTVTGFADLNGNGQHDPSEPQGTATVTWDGPTPPVQGQSIDVRPQKGTVRVKLPKNAAGKVAAKRLGVPFHDAASSFVKLTGNTPVPLGSILDTTKGTVRMLAAGSPTKSTGGSPFMGGSFNGGVFRTRQVNSKGLTEMAMVGALRCKGVKVPHGGVPKVVESRKRRRSRSLFGNAHGRFRTRGRNSSATVRGTKWLQKDTCSGTLTVVKRGSVFVRDFRKKKTKVVRKGHRYFARAAKRRG